MPAKESKQSKSSDRPQSNDVVLGGQLAPGAGMVLGGLSGVKWRLASPDPELRVAALYEAVKYGSEGLEILLQALSYRSWSMQRTAYTLLESNLDQTVQQRLQQYNPYQLFDSLHTLSGHTQPVCRVVFSPNPHTILSCGSDEIIRIWDLQIARTSHTLDAHHSHLIPGLNGKTVFTAGNGEFVERDLETGQVIEPIFGQVGEQISAITLSQDESIFAYGTETGTIRVHWTLQPDGRTYLLRGHTQAVNALVLNPGEQILVSAGEDIKLWDWRSQKLLKTLTGHTYEITCLAISPDGQTLFSGSHDYTIRMWDLQKKQLIRTFNGHSSSVTAIVLSPDGHTLFSGSGDKTIKIWDLRTRKEIHTLRGHTGWVTCLALSPDGELLVSGSDDRTIRVWGLG